MGTIIKIENIQKLNPRFGNKPEDRKFLLNNFSGEISAGKTSLIIGKNGSGKSTLLKCIAGLTPFESGNISVLGNEVKYELAKNTPNPNIANRHKLGVIFQDKALWENYTVLQNVMQPLLHITKNKKDTLRIEQTAKTLLEKLKIPESKFRNFPNQISGGEQRKVAVARTLITDPEILLIDELEANLDLEALNVILKVLREDYLHIGKEDTVKIIDNKTLIIISHRIDLIELNFAPEYFLLSDNTGELLVHTNSFQELKSSKSSNPQIAQFIKSVIDPANSQWYFGTTCLRTAMEISRLISEDANSKMEETFMLQKVGEKLFELITKFEPEEGHLLMIVTKEEKTLGDELYRIRSFEITEGTKNLKLDGKDIGHLCKKIREVVSSIEDGNEFFTQLKTNYKDILRNDVCELIVDNSAIENVIKNPQKTHYESTRFHGPIYGCRKVKSDNANEPSIQLCKNTSNIYLIVIQDEDEILGVISIDTTSKDLWSNTIMEQFVVVANMAAIAIKQSKKKLE